MQFTIELDEKLALVIAVIKGRLDADGFERYLELMEQLAPFPAGTDLLLIFAPGTEFAIDAGQIRSGALRPATFDETAIRVVVAADRLAFGLTRMFAGSSPRHGGRYRVVKTIDDAATELSRHPATLAAAVERVSEAL